MIKIVIADDHEIVLRGLRMTIQGEEDMQLVGEARTGRQAVELVRAIQPDVVLMDIQMPEMNGIEATNAIHAEFPKIAVIILTSFRDDVQLHTAFKAGASGYLLKDVSGEALVQAIRGAHQGEPQLHPEVARRLMQRMEAPHNPLAELTTRETEVLRLIARGLSNKEIGNVLSLTEVTVKGYVSTVLSKLGVQDRTQAALLAVRYGLVGQQDLPDAPLG